MEMLVYAKKWWDVCLFLYLFFFYWTCLSFMPSNLHRQISIAFFLTVFLSVCQSVLLRLSFCLTFCLSFCSSVWLDVWLVIRLHVSFLHFPSFYHISFIFFLTFLWYCLSVSSRKNKAVYTSKPLQKDLFLVAKSNSIRGFVHPSVGPLVRLLVRGSVDLWVTRVSKTANSSKFK